jgi:SAM-dependent methyltransferase
VPDRALSFGPVAAAYERFRPGYPVELLNTVGTYAGRPIHTALEIGAGTGKATRLFAEHGIAVTATEPDPAMLAELRRHAGPNVVAVQCAFEDLHPTATYPLVFAAAALHWTNPDGRWPRIAALLEPDGIFASFGGPVALADVELGRAVRAAHAPFLDTDEVASPDGTPPEQHMQWPGTELQQSADFTDVRQILVERRWTATAPEYVGYLSTVSAYLQLPAADREEVFGRILSVLPEHVHIRADVVAHLARRR